MSTIQEYEEPIDVTKLDNKKILHVIDNETGFCSICNKFENPSIIKKNYIKCGEIKVKTKDVHEEINQTNTNVTRDGARSAISINSEHSAFEQTIFKQNKRNNLVVTNELFDLFKGRMCFKSCSFCDSICYVPIWFLILLLILTIALLVPIIYLSVTYANLLRTDLKTYAQTCLVTSDCDTSKGLYCRTKIASSEEYCNCPTFSSSNMCDCSSSSYYWNGAKCAGVFGYGEGPCSGNYSCTVGLICDRASLKCICPPTTPLFNAQTKTCDYYYLGCYNYCLNKTKCDVTGGSFVLTGFTIPIDLDVCLLQCQVYKSRYAIFLYASQFKCACTNTYNQYATQASDTECSLPCNYFNPIGVGRCPLINGKYSAFQIGA